KGPRLGARRARLPETVLVERQVLAERRPLHRPTDPAEQVEAPLEVLLVGEDRDRVGAPRRVRPGERLRIEVGRQNAARRRRLLHLGDQPDGAAKGPQRGLEVARRRETGTAALESGAGRLRRAAG